MAKTVKKEVTAKKVVKKIIANLAMALVMIAIGFAVATAAYAAGFRFVLPKISVEWSSEEKDLVLVDRADLLGKAVSSR